MPKETSMEEEVIKLLKSAGIEASEEQLERPPQPKLGDIAFPCFHLAKKEKKSPQDIARDIAEEMNLDHAKSIVRAEAKGGYINFFFDWERLAEKILKDIKTKDKKYGRPAKLKKQKIMVEYSQPNPVHSMHIGHARGTFLGDALANIFEFMGHKVIRANYMNDCGLQVAKLVTSIKLWADNKSPEGKEDEWLWKYYVRFHEEAEEDATLETKAREILKQIDVDKKKDTVALRNKIVKWCIAGFDKTYEKVGIKFDMYLHESKFRDQGKKIVEKALKKKLAFESEEKTIVADLEKHNMPGLVILRSDGTGLYQTSDLGMTVHKFEKLKVDKAIWVVASAQNLYFRQIKKLLELLGYKWAKDDAIHFSFDLVRLPEGKMSSRKGKAILLDEVIDKLVDMAEKEIEKREISHTEQEKKATAKSIGVGALKYAIEKVEPDKGITFDFKKMLSFDGNTGPYLQYAHTRCASILAKAGKHEPSFKVKQLKKEEKELVRMLADFPKTVGQAAKEMRINQICNYAYDVATAFSTFYNACPVLKADSAAQRDFRLSLVAATKTVLRNALTILGMDALEKM
jgi:arginyl-tRNA synthetase